ncbi:MAG TPA: peptide-modifying radical SAM enzyme CbpB [Thermodesulforhabdus norvegica]|uniref:Peptide-modifying radical SAM enzyme CbpB n=1 Tax=Thermodesulforhabdus norvegica TaxID=39841 RepID=A0A7C0WUD1_9BACT|nr:peptide-modifying radical SAM enzyme CbpB [Thermodesulforhabdus norvegica]
MNGGKYANSGYGPSFAVLDIGVEDRVAVVEPDTGFWALVETDGAMRDALSGELVEKFFNEENTLRKEMHFFRFELKPSAVYFNPTERCNFNCTYCYIPEDMRRNGVTMTETQILEALERLKEYFLESLPEGVKPQIIFHGSEPMMVKDNIFRAIEKFNGDFLFGIQTNGSLLTEDDIDFLKEHSVGIGLSLDAPVEDIADSVRKNWSGHGAFKHIIKVLEKLNSYSAYNVITTVTRVNCELLPKMIDFYADHGVHMVMLNPVRCTQRGGKDLKPDNGKLAHYFCKALDRTQEILDKTGHKIVVVNFANVLAGILGPTTRRLMCDISPCGGGRCFFAVAATGDIFPCSEFVGFPEFCGGNVFKDSISQALESSPIKKVTSRIVENISPCNRCAIRHFCGAPCPAEVYSLNGDLNSPAPYCSFYEEQVRYAFRIIARGEELNFLWNGWDDETEQIFHYSS